MNFFSRRHSFALCNQVNLNGSNRALWVQVLQCYIFVPEAIAYPLMLCIYFLLGIHCTAVIYAL